jgi:hypothetical protein
MAAQERGLFSFSWEDLMLQKRKAQNMEILYIIDIGIDEKFRIGGG